ncbi:MAG: hypothetical protein H0U73_04120 [Tatlockia sp.]|nr:hypothetical protein [Tatlockia sp.]
MKMKICDEQRNAASLYWTQVLTRELNPQSLIDSTKKLPSFMASMENVNRMVIFQKLETENPLWPTSFLMILDEILRDSDVSTILRLEYKPQGLLKEAAKKAGIPEALFPCGKLLMTFDNEGHIIVDGEKIDANSFMDNATKEMISSKL